MFENWISRLKFIEGINSMDGNNGVIDWAVFNTGSAAVAKLFLDKVPAIFKENAVLFAVKRTAAAFDTFFGNNVDHGRLHFLIKALPSISFLPMARAPVGTGKRGSRWLPSGLLPWH